MTSNPSRPPRLARWLLARGLPIDARETVLGDLDEEYACHQCPRGRVQARVWYWSQALRTITGINRPRWHRPRDARNGGPLLIQDLHHGLRLLRSQWGFSAIAMATLAVGIGLSTALFTVIHAAWIRPLPFPHPEQLVRVDVVVAGARGESKMSPAVNDIRAWRASGRAVSHGALDRGAAPLIVDAGTPERVQVASVSEGYFEMLAISPIAGRTFRPDDLSRAQPLVVMLGHRYWRTRFNGDPAVLGRTVSIDNAPAEIVGIVPAGFRPDVAVWQPFRSVPESFRGSGAPVILRLRAGLTHEAARAALTEDLRSAGSGAVLGVQLASLHEETVRGARTTLKTLGAAVAAILLLACVNVAGLLLARGATRRRELAVRASLGGTRLQLIRLLLAESVVLALSGGAAGVLLAWISIDGLVALLPLDIPATAAAALNIPVLTFATMASLASALLFGTLPAVRLSRVRVTEALARTDHRAGGNTLRGSGRTLIAVEVAIAVTLVAAAGLMIRSFIQLAAVDLGFDPESFLVVEAAPADPSPAVAAAYYPALLDAVRALPGVAAAGAGNQLPIGGSRRAGSVNLPGREPIRIDVRLVTPGYFETLGIPVRAGRLPSEADRRSGRLLVILNETAAERIFAGESALGRLVPFESYSSNELRSFEVIAIVSDTLQDGARSPRRANVYTLYQGTESLSRSPFAVFVRPRGSMTGLAERLRTIAESIGPRAVVDRIRPGTAFVSDSIGIPRRRMQLLGVLAIVGLALALVGVFSVTAFAVGRRTTEIGVRMALGARPAVVVRQIVGDAARPIAVGLVVGLAGAVLASRLVTTFLYQTSPHDVPTFALAVLVLAATSLAAAWLPARKAARIDPVSAMRAE